MAGKNCRAILLQWMGSLEALLSHHSSPNTPGPVPTFRGGGRAPLQLLVAPQVVHAGPAGLRRRRAQQVLQKVLAPGAGDGVAVR